MATLLNHLDLDLYLYIYSTEKKVWKDTFVTKETYFLFEKCSQVTS